MRRNRLTRSERKELLKWIITGVLVPIAVALIQHWK